MPIYEFYCEDCNTIFSFFSKSVNTNKKPTCPKCKTKTLTRQMSAFAFTGKAKEDSDMDDLPIDEAKMDGTQMVLGLNVDFPRSKCFRINPETLFQRAGALISQQDTLIFFSSAFTSPRVCASCPALPSSMRQTT